MDKALRTRVVNFTDLSSKKLINDLKDVVICDVKSVCTLPCDRCPYATEYIDLSTVKLLGLTSYAIKLQRTENEQLLLHITAVNIDKWLEENNIPIFTPT